jgi:hypothetical protein
MCLFALKCPSSYPSLFQRGQSVVGGQTVKCTQFYGLHCATFLMLPPPRFRASSRLDGSQLIVDQGEHPSPCQVREAGRPRTSLGESMSAVLCHELCSLSYCRHCDRHAAPHAAEAHTELAHTRSRIGGQWKQAPSTAHTDLVPPKNAAKRRWRAVAFGMIVAEHSSTASRFETF